MANPATQPPGNDFVVSMPSERAQPFGSLKNTRSPTEKAQGTYRGGRGWTAYTVLFFSMCSTFLQAGLAHTHAVFALQTLVLTCKHKRDNDLSAWILMSVGLLMVALVQAMHLFRLRPWLWVLSLVLIVKGGIIVRLHGLQKAPS